MKCVPIGPSSRTRLTKDSPSFKTGGADNFSTFTSLHVIRVGMHTLPGGITRWSAEWRVLRRTLPRASTRKLDRKLSTSKQSCTTNRTSQTAFMDYIQALQSGLKVEQNTVIKQWFRAKAFLKRVDKRHNVIVLTSILNRVDINSVFSHESFHFTDWLLANKVSLTLTGVSHSPMLLVW